MEKPVLNCLPPALNCLPALFFFLNQTYRDVPGIVFQPIRLRLSLSNWSCAAISPSACSLTKQSRSILTNQDCAFLTNQTVRIWSPYLHKNDPIRDWGRDISLYKSPLLWLREHTFPLHLGLKIAFPHLELKH